MTPKGACRGSTLRCPPGADAEGGATHPRDTLHPTSLNQALKYV